MIRLARKHRQQCSGNKLTPRGAIWTGTVLLLLLIVVPAGATLTVMLSGSATQFLLRKNAVVTRADLAGDVIQAQAEINYAASWPPALLSGANMVLSQPGVQTVRHATVRNIILDVSRAVDNGMLSSRVELTKFPFLLSIPAAPVVYNGSTPLLGTFALYLPPAGSHPDFVYSLWSASSVDMSVNGRMTCADSFSGQDLCPVSPLSNTPFKSADIKDADNKIAIPPGDYLFGLDLDNADLTTIALLSRNIYTDCQTLPASDVIVYVKGDCTLSGNKILGNTASPVLLIVENGHIKMEDDAVVNGVVVSYRNNSGFSRKIQISDSAIINGSLLLNHPATADSHLRVAYHYTILQNLQHHPLLQQTGIVPGTAHP